MKMAKAPKEDISKLSFWMMFNDVLCKYDPTIRTQWKELKEELGEENFGVIYKHCEDEDGRFEWEYYMDYYREQISHIHMRIIYGYEVLLDNVCDPEADTLEYKKEILDKLNN
jgi:hypothetical protein